MASGHMIKAFDEELDTLRGSLDSLPEIEPASVERPDMIGDLESGDYEQPDEV